MKNYNDIINQWNDVKNAFSDLKNALKDDKEIQVNDVISKVPFDNNLFVEFDSKLGRATVVDTEGTLQYCIKLSFWAPSLLAYLYDADNNRIGKVRRRWISFPDIEDYLSNGCRQYEKFIVTYGNRRINIVSYIKKKNRQRFFVPQENKGKLVGDTVGFYYDFILNNSSKARIIRLTQRLKELMVHKYVVSCDDINEEIILLYAICLHLFVIK